MFWGGQVASETELRCLNQLSEVVLLFAKMQRFLNDQRRNKDINFQGRLQGRALEPAYTFIFWTFTPGTWQHALRRTWENKSTSMPLSPSRLPYHQPQLSSLLLYQSLLPSTPWSFEKCTCFLFQLPHNLASRSFGFVNFRNSSSSVRRCSQHLSFKWSSPNLVGIQRPI